MSKLIVDYCIESYERRLKGPKEAEGPKVAEGSEDPKRPLSIHQTFSKAINSIVRDTVSGGKMVWSLKVLQGRRETRISNDFRPSLESDHSSVFPRKINKDGKRSKKSSTLDDLTKATETTQDLSNAIKDIRDELNILKAITQFQQDVQEALYKSLEGIGISQEKAPNSSKKALLMEPIQRLQAKPSAAHVFNDIREMDSVATRIQAAVNTTLSLQQSDTANLQAQEAVRQGRTLMVFTLVTIFFLPLSFLSSMFALDVENFQQAPGWVFAIMFSVPVVLFIPLTGWAKYSDEVKVYTHRAWGFMRHGRGMEIGKGKAPSSAGKQESSKLDHSQNEFSDPAPRRRTSRRQPDEEEGRRSGT